MHSNDIKLGDWVWMDGADMKVAFVSSKCNSFMGVDGKSYHPDGCVKLEPYSSINDVKIGERCVGICIREHIREGVVLTVYCKHGDAVYFEGYPDIGIHFSRLAPVPVVPDQTEEEDIATIKVGDWFWYDAGEGPELKPGAYQASSIWTNGKRINSNKGLSCGIEFCTKLKPYRYTDKAKVGDRCVCLNSEYAGGGLKLGGVYTVSGEHDRERIFLSGGGTAWAKDRFAPIPSGQKVVEDKPETVEPEPFSGPCPRPELLGIWRCLDIGYRVTWERERYVATGIKDASKVLYPIADGDGLGKYWHKIEPAVSDSPEVKKTEEIKIPWDPFGFGW